MSPWLIISIFGFSQTKTITIRHSKIVQKNLLFLPQLCGHPVKVLQLLSTVFNWPVGDWCKQAFIFDTFAFNFFGRLLNENLWHYILFSLLCAYVVIFSLVSSFFNAKNFIYKNLFYTSMLRQVTLYLSQIIHSVFTLLCYRKSQIHLAILLLSLIRS